MLPFALSQSRRSMLASKPTAAQRPRSALTPSYQSVIRRFKTASESARDMRAAQERTMDSLIFRLAPAPDLHPRPRSAREAVVTEIDPALAEVVRGQLERHLVPGEDADAVLLQLPRHVRHHLVAVGERDTKPRVGKLVRDDSFHLDEGFLGHQTTFRSTAERRPSSSLRTS